MNSRSRSRGNEDDRELARQIELLIHKCDPDRQRFLRYLLHLAWVEAAEPSTNEERPSSH